jgi:hypothetical protein
LRCTDCEQNDGKNARGESTFPAAENGTEVDFVWERGKTRVGIEVKAATGQRRKFGNTLAQLREERSGPQRSPSTRARSASWIGGSGCCRSSSSPANSSSGA